MNCLILQFYYTFFTKQNFYSSVVFFSHQEKHKSPVLVRKELHPRHQNFLGLSILHCTTGGKCPQAVWHLAFYSIQFNPCLFVFSKRFWILKISNFLCAASNRPQESHLWCLYPTWMFQGQTTLSQPLTYTILVTSLLVFINMVDKLFHIFIETWPTSWSTSQVIHSQGSRNMAPAL